MANWKFGWREWRWGTESMAFNLGRLPADKLNWKPNPESKSALEVTGEVIGVMRMMVGLIDHRRFHRARQRGSHRGRAVPLPDPSGLEDAQRQLAETGNAFATALEKAGAELERPSRRPSGRCWGRAWCCGE